MLTQTLEDDFNFHSTIIGVTCIISHLDFSQVLPLLNRRQWCHRKSATNENCTTTLQLSARPCCSCWERIKRIWSLHTLHSIKQAEFCQQASSKLCPWLWWPLNGPKLTLLQFEPSIQLVDTNLILDHKQGYDGRTDGQTQDMEGLTQDCSNSGALAKEQPYLVLSHQYGSGSTAPCNLNFQFP